MKTLIVGGGKLVYFLSRTLMNKGHKVTIINNDKIESNKLARQLDINVVYGDGSDPEILEDAGAFYVEALLALTPYDQVNFYVCQMANIYFQIPRILTLVNDPDNEKVFKELGIADAVSTTHILSGMIEQSAVFDDMVSLIPIEEGKVRITEVPLQKTAKIAGKRIQDLDLPKDSLIAGVIRKGKPIIPGGVTLLRRGDRVILVSLPETHEEALEVLREEY